ncbi:hypothetical protein Q5O14_12115 [Eubacteriaceae bacterium ES2]|nr:hypothetical protein Q5O14_12115 [Eubacteriaceae bacterium ES2]
MKKYIQESLMLSAIIVIIVTLISFLFFEYRNEMALNFLIVLIAFGGMGIHYLTACLFYDSFLKEVICKYILVELMVLLIGELNSWFINTNWWMSLVYVTPVFILAYFLGIVQIKREVQFINRKLAEKKENKE